MCHLEVAWSHSQHFFLFLFFNSPPPQANGAFAAKDEADEYSSRTTLAMRDLSDEHSDLTNELNQTKVRHKKLFYFTAFFFKDTRRCDTRLGWGVCNIFFFAS